MKLSYGEKLKRYGLPYNDKDRAKQKRTMQQMGLDMEIIERLTSKENDSRLKAWERD